MTSYTYRHARKIRPGLQWTQAIRATGQFLAGMTWAAHIRRSLDGDDIAALTTDNGGFVRTDDNNAYLYWAVPADLATGTAIISIKRTDTTPDAHLGAEIRIAIVHAGTE